MSMNDPLGDMLTRIRNGQMAGKSMITCPHSKLHENVLSVLKDEGFVRDFKSVDLGSNKKEIQIFLKYSEGRGAIREMARVSKPGRRVYTNAKEMPRFYNGLGILILSTPHGVIPDHKARAANVGGEILCQVF